VNGDGTIVFFKGVDTWPMSGAFTLVAGLLVIGFVIVLVCGPHLIWRSFVSTWPVQLAMRAFGKLRGLIGISSRPGREAE
jgi:hypothetical protein